jgi:hypothetical protein
MSVCKVCIALVFVNFSHGAQLNAQVESQMFGYNADTVFEAIRRQIEGEARNWYNMDSSHRLPENADIDRALYDGNRLSVQDIMHQLDEWRPAFSGSGIAGSNSGSVVAISDRWILKSEDASFYANFQKIKDDYLTRASQPDSCLQKIRGVFWTGSVSYTYWFLIENSNVHARGRNLFRYDMKASRQIGKNSGYTGAAGKLGFTDDFFYMKDLQSWTYTQPLTQENGRNVAVRKAIEDDLKIFYKAWDRSTNAIKLVDYSILVFVNSIPAQEDMDLDAPDYVSPSNCVQFTRVNPETGAEETLEMCFSIIDFFANLSLSKQLGQKPNLIKVYGCHNKFNRSYATRLNRLMGDMLAETTTVPNIVNHYVPQARERFQKNAMVLAGQYIKANKFNRSLEAFVADYYRSNPHGLPRVILDPLYKICAYGLSKRVEEMLPKFVENFNITSGDDEAESDDDLWALVEEKVARMGGSGRLARTNTAQMFSTKYDQLKPRNGKVTQVRPKAVRLSPLEAQEVRLRFKRSRRAQVIG